MGLGFGFPNTNPTPNLTQAAAGCATLQCVAESVAALPTVAKWVEARPVTAF